MNKNISTVNQQHDKERGLMATLFIDLPIACVRLVGIIVKTYTVGLPARINLWRYKQHLSKKNKQ